MHENHHEPVAWTKPLLRSEKAPRSAAGMPHKVFREGAREEARQLRGKAKELRPDRAKPAAHNAADLRKAL